MTDAFTYHVPITAEMYARIKHGLGPQIPPHRGRAALCRCMADQE